MKRYLSFVLMLAVVATSLDLMAQSKAANGKTNASFDKLKSLAGEWQGKDSKGQPLSVSYRVVSGGSAVMETLTPASEPEMITVYHVDGDNLMMTHYCSIGNQPRMRAQTPAGEVKNLSFKFADATNMAKPSDGHMHALTLTFQDNDHFTQEWSMRHEGKDMPVTFNLERK